MKITQLIAIVILLFGFTNENYGLTTSGNPKEVNNHLAISTQTLIVIDQDYEKALKIASETEKLIFIDFYTSWCAPCKELDKLVLQNDSVQQILQKDFILLKYDAEIDSIFHLSKKHHVRSYPTGLILNSDAFVVNRKYGFPGNDFQSISNNLLEFTNKSIELNRDNKVLKGYSTKIDDSNYPLFYSDYVDRRNIKKDSSQINEYLLTEENTLTEEYFSTLIYFASDASDEVSDKILKNNEAYLELYGKLDVEILFYYLTVGKFRRAIAEKSQEKYAQSVAFAKATLSKRWTDDILPSFEIDLLKSQNKWDEVFEIYNTLKANGEMDNDYVNHFSWQVYKDCDDQKVIQKCLAWMKEVTDNEPTYQYLDTYAYLMYKSGDMVETSRIATLAVEAGKKEGDSTKSMQKLLAKL